MKLGTRIGLRYRLWTTALVIAVATGAILMTPAAQAEEKMVDAKKILSDVGVYGLYNTLKLRPSFAALSASERGMVADEVEAVVAKHSKSVLVQAYLTRGYKAGSDYMLRLHAYEPAKAQAFLIDFGNTRVGRHSDVEVAMIGVTKALNHTTKKKAPELLEQLKAGKYTGEAPKYAFMIPIKKDAAWWNLSEQDKLTKMVEHTVPTLPYLVNVKRKLYHSTGLDDTDFITYFETNDLVAFNDLNIALHSVPEMLNNTRYGRPIVMGTIMPIKDVFATLSK
jgi:chlorite dismutase